MKNLWWLMRLLFLVVAATTVSAKEWQGITPLHSTCEDVKQKLKVDKCTFPISEYDIPDFRVVIFFSQNQSCSNSQTWHVPHGTVTGLIILPTKEILPSTLGIDLSKYKKLEDGDIVGVERFENLDEGATVSLFNGFVHEVLLYPSSRDDKLRCKLRKSRQSKARSWLCCVNSSSNDNLSPIQSSLFRKTGSRGSSTFGHDPKAQGFRGVEIIAIGFISTKEFP